MKVSEVREGGYDYETELKVKVKETVITDKASYDKAIDLRNRIWNEVTANITLLPEERDELGYCWKIVSQTIEKWEEGNPQYLI